MGPGANDFFNFIIHIQKIQKFEMQKSSISSEFYPKTHQKLSIIYCNKNKYCNYD